MALPWVPVIALLAFWASVWEELPSTLAVHFRTDGSPDLWMSRTTALGAALQLGILVAGVASVRANTGASAWARASDVFGIAGVCSLMTQVLYFNAFGTWHLVAPGVCFFLAALIGLVSRRREHHVN